MIERNAETIVSTYKTMMGIPHSGTTFENDLAPQAAEDARFPCVDGILSDIDRLCEKRTVAA